MNRRTFLAALLLVALVFSWASPVFAQGGGGQVIFGRDYTVESGETVDGDLVVFGGHVTVEAGGKVEGDVAVIGGRVTVNAGGEIEGSVVVIGGQAQVAGSAGEDVVAIGGAVKLESTASVGGDVVAPFGSVEKKEGAEIGGRIMEGFYTNFSYIMPLRGIDLGTYLFTDLVLGLLRNVIILVALMAVGLLVVAVIPRQVETVSQAIQKEPLASIGVGFLSLLLVGLLALLLMVTCIGIPVALLLLIAFLAAVVYGWVAVGYLGGQRLLEAAKVKEIQPLAAVLLGVFLITLVSFAPCLGAIFFVVVGSWGLGGVILTRMGTVPYPLRRTARAPATSRSGARKPRRRKGLEE